jgi:hypothetical protein
MPNPPEIFSVKMREFFPGTLSLFWALEGVQMNRVPQQNPGWLWWVKSMGTTEKKYIVGAELTQEAAQSAIESAITCIREAAHKLGT